GHFCGDFAVGGTLSGMAFKGVLRAARWFEEGFAPTLRMFNDRMLCSGPAGLSKLSGLFGKSQEVAQCTKSNLRLGQQVHKSYKAAIADKKIFRKEFTLPSGRRVDFIDFTNGKVYELKPNNPRAIRAGMKQLEQYIKELKEHPKLKHIEWEGVLETY
ncbi:MAG: hypothetical protein KGJ02_08750, partial [Verrucomicrobiota bacterium]|nr:hypothetical protein [Verrucomicrobiota bacterium]